MLPSPWSWLDGAGSHALTDASHRNPAAISGAISREKREFGTLSEETVRFGASKCWFSSLLQRLHSQWIDGVIDWLSTFADVLWSTEPGRLPGVSPTGSRLPVGQNTSSEGLQPCTSTLKMGAIPLHPRYAPSELPLSLGLFFA